VSDHPTWLGKDLQLRREAAAKKGVADAVLRFLELEDSWPAWERLLGEVCQAVNELRRIRRLRPPAAMAGSAHVHRCSGCGERGHNLRTCQRAEPGS